MKFASLFKKELREMLSPQTIIMLVFVLIVMVGLSGMVNGAMDEAQEESSKITICDLDDTDFSRSVIKFLKTPAADMKNDVKIIKLESDDYAKEINRLGLKSFIVVPEGFTESVNKGEQAKLIYVSKMTSLSTMSNVNSGSETAVTLIEAAVKSALYTDKVSKGQLTEDEVTQLNSPVDVQEQTIVGGKSANISQLILYSASYSQTMLMPLVVYMLILLGSQTMINAVAAEKLDKTLETLLSAPVSRISVLSAKMLAAAVVALLNAVVYMVGMNNMTSGVSSSLPDNYTEMAKQLGLNFTTTTYVMIGAQMLVSTLIALSVSIILGAFAKRVKSSQMLSMPILFITVVPFMVSMFMDISSLPGAVRYLLYAIPFTHTFMASDCILFGKTSLYIGGLIYQIIFLIVCMAIALKIFTSDKIFTASETRIFGKKKKHAEAD